MNSQEINNILHKICGDIFIGVFARDRLPTEPKRPALMVVNTDKARDPGEHWIAMFLNDDGTGEYFDSLAQEDKHFDSYMNKHCISWIRSTRQLQSITSRFCGHYVVVYSALRSRGHNLNEVARWFTPDYGFNDLLVHEFVCRRLS
jgi:hypothetical protein